MKTNKILLSIGLSLLLLGCNSSSNDKKSDTPQTQKILVPKTIEMNVPKALKKEPTSSQTSFQKTDASQVNQSRGYLQLKDEIANAQEERKVVQVNLLLADKLMPKIQALCVDIPLSQTCEIGEGQLTFVLDSAMRTDIGNIVGETLPNEPDKAMSLGKTTFTIYPDSEDYQYSLVLDMSPMVRRDLTDTTVYLQTLKWSKDEKHVWSIYNTGENASMSLRYTKNANGQTQMEIDDNSKLSGDALSAVSSSASSSVAVNDSTIIDLSNDTPSVQSMEELFHFKLSNKDDYFKIVSNSSSMENGTAIGSSSSVGELSDKGGYLDFKGSFFETEYRESQKFDGNGEVVFSGYCDSSQECDMNDKTTWLEYGDDTFEPAIESEMVSLSVSGGDLKEGGYLLLAPNTDISKLSTEAVFDAVVGDVYVSEKTTFGTLYTKEYISQLDSLPLVYLIFDAQNPNKKPVFELIGANKRPTLTQE